MARGDPQNSTQWVWRVDQSKRPHLSEIVLNIAAGFKGFLMRGKKGRGEQLAWEAPTVGEETNKHQNGKRLRVSPKVEFSRYDGLVDGHGAVVGRDADEGGAGAKLDALAVVVPGFTAFGADTGAALKRTVAVGFEDDAGFVTRGNLKSHRAIGGMSFEAGTIPGITGEREGDGSILGVDILFAAVVFERDGPIVGIQIKFAGAAGDGDRTVLSVNFENAVNVVKAHGAVLDLEVESGGLWSAHKDVSGPAVMRRRAGNAELAVFEGEMDLGKEGVGIAAGFRRFAEGDGVGVLVPALGLDAAVGFGEDAKRGSFGPGDGSLFGLEDGVVVVEADVKIGAGGGKGLVIGDGGGVTMGKGPWRSG